MIRYLLDTQVFLFLTAGLPVGKITGKAFADPDAKIFLSMASIWEMSIKQSLRKLKLSIPLKQILSNEMEQNGLEILPIRSAHAIAVQDLPFLHRDPFDRLLLCQASIEEMILLSNDKSMRKYKQIQVKW